jgi:hypothetical protein
MAMSRLTRIGTRLSWIWDDDSLDPQDPEAKKIKKRPSSSDVLRELEILGLEG